VNGAGAFATHERKFIGRSAERTLLRHLLHEAGHGQLAIVVVSGVPGAGKTLVLEWLADAAGDVGADVLWASGYESSLPFAALSRLVAPFRELSNVIPLAGPNGTSGGPSGPAIGASTTGSLPGVIVDAILRRARRRLQVIVLDDVQDLGEASLAVLSDALVGLDDAGARQRLQLLVVLSARTPLEADGLADRVLRLRAARAVSLGGFDDQEALEFLAAAGWRPGRSAVRELLDQTGGLPLLVESAVHQRRGASGTGVATNGRAIDSRVRSISDALRLRFDQIDDVTRQTLQRAALLGDPWSPRELATVSERTPAELDSMIGAAERANLVERRGQTVRFAHPLVRSELLERFAPSETAEAHREIAARLGTLHGGVGPMDDELQLRIADHLLRAKPEPANQSDADHVLRAGRTAMRWTAYDQATRFLTAAARSAIGVQPAPEVALRFLEAGRAAYYDYDHDLAESLLAEAISCARDGRDDGVRLAAATTLTRMRGSKRARPQDDVDVTELRAALEEHGDVDLGVLVQAEAALAEVLVGSRRGDAADSILASARRSSVGVRPDPSIADALARLDFATALSRMTVLDLYAANDLFDGAMRNALAAGNPLVTSMARSRLAVVGLLRGAIGEAHAALVEVVEQTSAHGFWGETGLAAALLAFAEVFAGRPGAVDRAEQAHRHWQRTKNPWNAAILAAIGPVLAARAAPEPRPAHGAATPSWANPLGGTTSSVTSALAAVESNDARRASQLLASASWQGGFRGPPTLNNLVVAAALIEVGDLVNDHSMVGAGFVALSQLADRGVRTTLPWPALVDRLLAIGCRHGGDLEHAHRHVQAAFDTADLEGLAPERAKCLLERARIAAAGGSLGEAETAMADAVRAFDVESMHGWIARCDEVGRSLQLPPALGSSGVIRERTIMTNDVVGSTLSNARLGDVLYLEQLKVHDRILRARVREFHGVETKHTGDGLTVAFNDRGDAVRCALAAQRDFEAWNSDEPDLALRIRCGLAHGSLVPSGGDFHGLVQSAAARVCALAGAGEVLATAQVVEDCPPDAVATSIGYQALRGLPEDVEVFRLTEWAPEETSVDMVT
jgi:class 3 adenylate cyclase